MAFRFRLARVLRLRSQQRQQAQEALRRALDDVARVDAAIAAARAAGEHTRAQEDAAADDGMFTGADLLRWRTHEAAALASERVLQRERIGLMQTLERRREDVTLRRREERQLERLREKGLAQALADEERTTAAQLDELALRARPERG